MAEAAAPLRPTAERILDAAEDLFARHGFDATSLADVADRVGIRTPSLYSHFASKRELYEAVVERLHAPFFALHERFFAEAPTPETVGAYLGEASAYHAAHPNLARILQHAALVGGPQLELLAERWRPFFDRGRELAAGTPAFSDADASRLRAAVMAFTSILLGQVTLAPLYRELLGVEPLGDDALSAETRFLADLNRRLWDPA